MRSRRVAEQRKRHPSLMCFWQDNDGICTCLKKINTLLWCGLVMFNSVPHQNCHLGYLGPIFRFPTSWCELTGVIEVFLTGSPVQTDIEDGHRLLSCRRIFPCHNWAFGYLTWRSGKSPLFIGKSWYLIMFIIYFYGPSIHLSNPVIHNQRVSHQYPVWKTHHVESSFFAVKNMLKSPCFEHGGNPLVEL